MSSNLSDLRNYTTYLKLGLSKINHLSRYLSIGRLVNNDILRFNIPIADEHALNLS